VLHETADLWVELSDVNARAKFAEFVAAAQRKALDRDTAKHFRAIQAALEGTRS